MKIVPWDEEKFALGWKPVTRGGLLVLGLRDARQFGYSGLSFWNGYVTGSLLSWDETGAYVVCQPSFDLMLVEPEPKLEWWYASDTVGHVLRQNTFIKELADTLICIRETSGDGACRFLWGEEMAVLVNVSQSEASDGKRNEDA